MTKTKRDVFLQALKDARSAYDVQRNIALNQYELNPNETTLKAYKDYLAPFEVIHDLAVQDAITMYNS